MSASFLDCNLIENKIYVEELTFLSAPLTNVYTRYKASESWAAATTTTTRKRRNAMTKKKKQKSNFRARKAAILNGCINVHCEEIHVNLLHPAWKIHSPLGQEEKWWWTQEGMLIIHKYHHKFTLIPSYYHFFFRFAFQRETHKCTRKKKFSVERGTLLALETFFFID